MIRQIQIHTTTQGLREITAEVESIVEESGIQEGLCTVFLKHTSASLIIQENADPSAKRDLEAWMNRLVKEKDPLFTHTFEGPDDMPSHIRMVLTRSSETIPVEKGKMMLGTWQGLFLFEHRKARHQREIVVTVYG